MELKYASVSTDMRSGGTSDLHYEMPRVTLKIGL